jgi:hypothetical protein
MKITKESIKKFYEDHETQIKTGIKIAEIALGVTAAIVIGKKLTSGKNSVDVAVKTVDVPELPTRQLPQELINMGFEVYSDGGKCLEFANYNDKSQSVDLDINGLHDVVDMIQDIDGFGENTRVQAMFNVYNLDQ